MLPVTYMGYRADAQSDADVRYDSSVFVPLPCPTVGLRKKNVSTTTRSVGFVARRRRSARWDTQCRAGGALRASSESNAARSKGREPGSVASPTAAWLSSRGRFILYLFQPCGWGAFRWRVRYAEERDADACEEVLLLPRGFREGRHPVQGDEDGEDEGEQGERGRGRPHGAEDDAFEDAAARWGDRGESTVNECVGVKARGVTAFPVVSINARPTPSRRVRSGFQRHATTG